MLRKAEQAAEVEDAKALAPEALAAEALAKLKEKLAEIEKGMAESQELLTRAKMAQDEIELRAETLFLEFRGKEALRMKAEAQAMADAITQDLSDLQGEQQLKDVAKAFFEGYELDRAKQFSAPEPAAHIHFRSRTRLV